MACKCRSIPRPEYPRPQMVRDKWMNLNGCWEFEMDHGKSGKARKLYEAPKLEGKIIVPFCPESKLSGVEYKDFMAAVWYRREFTIPDDWASGRVLLHFGAVDYYTEIWINSVSIGNHMGGYTPFTFDITDYLKPGSNVVTVYAEDDVRSGLQPGGKQCPDYHSRGCHYTRTTGIWQTVWLESVPERYISSFKMIPDPDNGCIHIESCFKGAVHGDTFKAKALFNGKEMGMGKTTVIGEYARLSVKLSEIYLWGPDNPQLYDLEFFLYDNEQCIDKVCSYMGLRSVVLDDNKILINGKPIFQRLVLDQGFYPEGIYTAPTDEDLKRDIEISMGLGFNGARLHEKIFEPRFLYWADKLGYLVWGEHANWGLDISGPMGLERFLPEWLEALERDFNHPSIVGWCPFNETPKNQDNEVLRTVYRVTKMVDSTRPVIDTSGYHHVITDILDIHDYDQNPETFTKRYEPLKRGEGIIADHLGGLEYSKDLCFVSEYGGIWWSPQSEGWGYGERPKSENEFIERYKALTEALLNHPKMCAFCYTQLYDVEQEVNGLYSYDRKAKFDPEIIRTINSQKAAIEAITD